MATAKTAAKKTAAKKAATKEAAAEKAPAKKATAKKAAAKKATPPSPPGDGAGRDEALRDFKAVVNMSAAQIGKWLETAESKKVGFKEDDGGESVGHHSGRRIIELLGKKKGELDDADVAHMRKVVGYVRRHSAQRPKGDIAETPWRYSLMNWGHDPAKA